MSSKNPTPPVDLPANDPEIEPISPEVAVIILDEAIRPYIEDDWFVLDRSAYAARLTKGLRNLDVHVDLLGQVEISVANLTPLQESGRLVAWTILLASLLIALVLASIFGII